MTGFTERVVAMSCEGAPLVAVLTEPAVAPQHCSAAVLIVVGGPQYRVGAHRQFVKMARALAEHGHPAMRFDVRGMGDSVDGQRSFESLAQDIGAAVDALCLQVPDHAPVVLFGLCDGASAAMLYLDECRNQRVIGVCGANPWVRSEVGLAATQLRHHYRERLVSPAFWRRLMSGQVGVTALRSFAATLTMAWRGARGDAADSNTLPYMERMARGCARLPTGAVAIALSAEDMTAREFEEYVRGSERWAGVVRDRCTTFRYGGVDHTFSQPGAMTDLVRDVVAWIATLPGRTSRKAAAA